jgi:hypothetical protein
MQDRHGAREGERDQSEQARGANAGVAPVDAVVAADWRGLRRFDDGRRLAQRLVIRRRALEALDDRALAVGRDL